MKNRYPETNLLVNLFREKAERGEIASYEDMSQAIHANIHACRHRATSALAILQEEYGYVPRCIPTVGYQFAKDNGVAGYELQKFRQKVNNHAARFDGKLATLDYSKLSQDDLKQAIEANIYSSAVKMVSGDEFQKQIAKTVDNTSISSKQSRNFLEDAKSAMNALWHVS